MKIQCISNLAKSLPEELIKLENYKINQEFSLTVHKIYNVYAIAYASDCVWYALCQRSTDRFPLWYPENLFSIYMNKLSKFWCYAPNIEHYTEFKFLLAYPEWANNPVHYNYIIEGETEQEKWEQKIFANYRKLMDMEFADPDVTEKATALEDGWVMCPFCIDAWQPHSYSGMIVCPKCHHTMHNPYYIDFHAISDA